MKKYVVVLSLAITMLFALVACGTNDDADYANDNDLDSSNQTISQGNYSEEIVQSQAWFSENSNQRGVFWFGMSIPEAAKALQDKGITIKTDDQYGEYDEYGSTRVERPEMNERTMRFIGLDPDGFQESYILIFIDGALTGFWMMPTPHFVASDLVNDIHIYTERGLRIGDSLSRLEELYGEPLRIENPLFGSYFHFYRLDANYYLVVEVLKFGDEPFVDKIIYHINDNIYWLGAGISDDTIHINNNSILHQFDNLGFSIEFPAFWDGKYGLVEWGASGGNILLQIYHTATREELGSGYVGTLFNIGRVQGEHYTADEPPAMSGRALILAQVNGYTYFLNFPGDVQWNMDDPNSEAAREYLKMADQWEEIASSFRLMD